MAFLEWNDSFILGFPEIDAQHRKLIDMVNEAYQALARNKGSEIVMQVIQSLVIYSQTHFSLEEMYFNKLGYPKAQEHILEHQAFKRKAMKFQEDYLDGNAEIIIPMLDFISNWIRFHILGSDKAYAAYFKSEKLL